jgi:hypothetical protein
MAEVTAAHLIEKLTQLGATIDPKGEHLSLSFPEGQRQEIEALRPELERMKPQIIAALSDRQASPVQPTQRQCSQRPSPEWPDARCYTCNNYLYWHSIYGPILCATCHPPAAKHQVSSWLWVYGERKSRPQ